MNYQRKNIMFRLKFYAAALALVVGLFTAFVQTAHGQTIINPSFETDNVPPSPGYGAITGWTGGSGINNASGPFTDNGTIPDGQKAAFLQGGVALRQTVSGFTVGESYRLRYYENRRNAGSAANLQVTAGGATIVATHEVAAVGGTNPYVLKVSEPFTAAAALDIAFITSGTGDYTVLLDKIEIGRNLVVTNNNDSGAGSLRQAMIDAPAGSAISFSNAVRGTIALTSGDIVIDKNLTIVGPGADALIVSGGGVYVNSGVTAAVSGLTISDGGGIYNRGNLTLTDSIVRRNTGRGGFFIQVSSTTVEQIRGGGIYNRGTLTVAGSVISENRAQYGGGIYNQGSIGGGTLIITNSTVSQNTSEKTGGGIYNGTLDEDGNTSNNVYGCVTVNNSSIIGNSASLNPTEWNTIANTFDERAGGGLANEGGISTLTNSTVSGNLEFRACVGGCLPATGGVGIVNRGATVHYAPGEVNLINTTVADSIYSRGTVNARNSIVGFSFDGTLNSQGYNLITNTLNTTITGDTTGNILNTAARLAPLGFYGGLTETHALLSGSPAINSGNTATSPAADQRGAARVSTADIGAFELNNSANGGNFVVRLPDAFTETAYSYLIVPGRGSFSYTVSSGGAPTGFSLIDEEGYVSIGGRTSQTGVFNFSVTVTNGTDSFVTDYTVRVLDSGLPPLPGGCRANPVVTNKVGIGEGTLRQAVIDVCAGGTISFSAAVRGTIDLTRGRLIINKNLTIQGPGAGGLTIRNAAGVSNTGSFLVNSGVTAVIASLTVRDGFISGIRNQGTLTLTNMSVSDNLGNGILNSGTLTVANSIISRNGTITDGLTTSTDSGGGISSITGALTVTDSIISDNYASNGGGISATNVTITNSTIRNNKGGSGGSERGGGGLVISDGTATVTNSTISGNLSRVSSNTTGGAIRIEGGTLRLINSTVAYNETRNAGARGNVGGIYIGGTATLITRNSIIAMNDAAYNIFRFGGTLTSEGYNLIGNNFGTITGDTTGNIIGTANAPIDARLGLLAFNGGVTETHALLTGSPAINAGNTATSPAFDQRGAPRVGTADIGAFEFNSTPPAPVADLTVTKTHTGNFTQGNTGKTYTITVSNSGSGATSGLVSVTDTLPNGLGAVDIGGAGWSCNFSNLTCTRSDVLGAGASYPAITLTVNVAANAPGSVTNIASVSGGGETDTSNNQAADPTTITAAARYAISGTVRYGIMDSGQTPAAISGVNLGLTGSATSSAISSVSGGYQFSNLFGGNYTVTPSKTGEVKGINSLDATRIQQHLVGLTTLSANQLIAADTDGSGTVNSLDATRIQQRAVGMQTANIIGQWKFAPANRQYSALAGNANSQDYQAVLVGEVSGNWASAASFADDSETEEVLPKQESLIETADRFENVLSEQIDERMKQSADLESNGIASTGAKSQSAVAGGGEGTPVNVSLPPNAAASTGSSITIPVTVERVRIGQAIESFDFTVFYDPAVLQLASPAGSNTGTLSANCSVLANSPLSGRMVVSGACATAITTITGGVLYNLQFNVIGSSGQQTGLLFDSPSTGTQTFQFNSGTPAANTINGLFSVLGPTTASVTVSGKVTNNQGRGIRNVLITMTDSQGRARTAQTTAFGYYKFESVAAGETVTISAKARRFRFNQSSIVRTTNESVADADFVSE
jgi:uncharacterized repeat protein (TIGR01451 family)